MMPFALYLSPSLRFAPLYALTSAVLPTEQWHPAEDTEQAHSPRYDAAFYYCREPRSGDVIGAFIFNTCKVSCRKLHHLFPSLLKGLEHHGWVVTWLTGHFIALMLLLQLGYVH